jgi:hypothetical protein
MKRTFTGKLGLGIVIAVSLSSALAFADQKVAEMRCVPNAKGRLQASGSFAISALFETDNANRITSFGTFPSFDMATPQGLRAVEVVNYLGPEGYEDLLFPVPQAAGPNVFTTGRSVPPFNGESSIIFYVPGTADQLTATVMLGSDYGFSCTVERLASS